MKPWTLHELALAIGFRELGEDAAFIAAAIYRDERDVRVQLLEFDAMVFQARHRPNLEPGEELEWVSDDPKERPFLNTDLTRDAVKKPLLKPRKFRVSREALWNRQAPVRDVTAALMGDPDPDRSAYRKHAENSGDRR